MQHLVQRQWFLSLNPLRPQPINLIHQTPLRNLAHAYLQGRIEQDRQGQYRLPQGIRRWTRSQHRRRQNHDQLGRQRPRIQLP